MERRLHELTDADERFFPELVSAQRELLPEFYWRPDNMVRIRQDELGRPRVLIVLALVDGRIAGFIQANYIYVAEVCFLNLDFLAVLPEFRKHGCALDLLRDMRRRASGSVADGIPIVGILGLAAAEENEKDRFVARRLFLYARLGAQIRRDVLYRTPDYPADYVVWYPTVAGFAALPTALLARVLWTVTPYSDDQFTEFVTPFDREQMRVLLRRDPT